MNPASRTILQTGVFILVHPFGLASIAHAGAHPIEWCPVGENACVDTPLKMTFGIPVHLGATGKVVISRASDRQQVDVLDLSAVNFTDIYAGRSLRVEPITIDDTTAVIHPHSHILRPGESYRVTVDPQVFLNAAEQPAGEVKDSDNWTFTVKSATPQSAGKLVVAEDGTGDFCTVQGALDSVPVPNSERVVIAVKQSTY